MKFALRGAIKQCLIDLCDVVLVFLVQMCSIETGCSRFCVNANNCFIFKQTVSSVVRKLCSYDFFVWVRWRISTRQFV